VELFGPACRSGDRSSGKGESHQRRAVRETLRAGLAGTEPLVIEAVVDPWEYDVILRTALRANADRFSQDDVRAASRGS